MKTFKISIIVLSIIIAGLSSCKKDDSSSNSTTSSVSKNIQKGTWKIILYNDSGVDETYYFTGYSFSFNSNDEVIAEKNSSSVKGKWSTGIDDSQNKLYLDFSTNFPLDKLTDDWQIIEETSNLIRLQDISGGNGGTDLLSFEKN